MQHDIWSYQARHNNYNIHVMRHLSAKIAITLACAIILLHAVVPHHHHDCTGEVGFIFETEINCHCSHHHHDCTHDCDNHHSDHPFDICRLADMLSHLVLNSKEDEQMMTQVVKAEVHDLLLAILPTQNLAVCSVESGLLVPNNANVPWALPISPLSGGDSLRGPPLCA